MYNSHTHNTLHATRNSQQHTHVHAHQQKRLWDDSDSEWKQSSDPGSDCSVDCNPIGAIAPRNAARDSQKKGKRAKNSTKYLRPSDLPTKPVTRASTTEGPFVLDRRKQSRAHGANPVFHVWNLFVDTSGYLRLTWYDNDLEKAFTSDFFVVGYLSCVDYEFASNLGLTLAKHRRDAYPDAAPPVSCGAADNAERDIGIRFIVRHDTHDWDIAQQVVIMNWWLLYETLRGPKSADDCRFYQETTDSMNPTKSFRSKLTLTKVKEANGFGRRSCKAFMSNKELKEFQRVHTHSKITEELKLDLQLRGEYFNARQ
jgi:hypothetical protein